jgi:signal transduction histidine kinase
VHALAVVPLRARDRRIGALAIWRNQAGHPYVPDDLVLLQDLADRAALALENARLYAEARAAIGLRDEFLSVAAHELKTPLTGLRGSAQLVLRLLGRDGGIDPDRLRQRLAVIDEQAMKLAHLVDQLLDVSRLEAGRLALEPAPTDLVLLVGAVADAARTRTERHTISVRADEPITAVVDPLRLEQVLTNLLDNAIKYSPAGGPVELTLARPSDSEVAIGVADRGIGVAPEHRAHIFDRFYQAQSGQHYGGMGLGLYISRQIVELHGGTLEAEFPPEGGSRFVVRLPRGGRATSEAEMDPRQRP